MKRKSVGILIFNQIEVLDFCGPFEVLSVTRLDETQRQETDSPFEIVLIAQTNQPITTTGGMRVLPDYTLETCPLLDILIVPGGWGTRKEMYNDTLIDWLTQQAPYLEILASVCTGALLLGQAGLLQHKEATTHWKSLNWMQTLFPDTTVRSDQHVMQDGKLFTSAGISAGIDMSFRLITYYFGETVARATAQYMEYSFPENDSRRIQLDSMLIQNKS